MTHFRSLTLKPSHGSRSCTVSWTVAPELEDADIYVAFSTTGVKGSWQVRNLNAPVPGAVGFYVDEAFVIQTGHETGYYQLVARKGGDSYKSPKRGLFQQLGRRDYGVAHKIMQHEYFMARSRNGMLMYHMIPRNWGELSDNTDEITNLPKGEECPDVAEPSYGLRFKGGFFDPILTYVVSQQVMTTSVTDNPAALGSETMNWRKCRFLGYPKPARGHMFVDPFTDDRYVLADQVVEFSFRGIVPIAYEGRLILLPRNDPRYRVDVPEPPAVSEYASR